MQIAVTLPRAVPEPRIRPPQDNIPQTRHERDGLKAIIRAYVAERAPVPPLPLDELREHADRLVSVSGVDPTYRDYIAVLVSNEAWRDTLATVPYQRRLLLLPKCLRIESRCPAPFDEFGLLCKKCGLCSIQDLQEEAERLGYAVLVAEGSAIVTAIIETGKIEAVVGVSCLSVLERAFPYVEAAAIPGVAIPLLQDDCIDTTVDIDWVWDVIHLTSEDRTYRMDLDAIRAQVESWFTPKALDETLGPAETETEQIARAWLTRAGKRWRPFLTTCAYIALREDTSAAIPPAIRSAAVAVECFHKASLIHDDIEDQDVQRYDERTLHQEHGVPIALNVGDFLLGEGYRLLAGTELTADARVAMLGAAAAGHRTLSLGQGAELGWVRAPRPLTSLQVLDIFRKKTAPAFEVALQVGAACAGAPDGLAEVFGRYSEALGIAYQIRDDLEDFAGDDLQAGRPSLLMAVGLERARAHDETAAALLERAMRRDGDVSSDEIRRALAAVGAEDRCQRLLESYKEEAIRSLAVLENASLKGLLRRVIGKIFNDLQVKGWCSEFEARNAAGREAGAAAAL